MAARMNRVASHRRSHSVRVRVSKYVRTKLTSIDESLVDPILLGRLPNRVEPADSDDDDEPVASFVPLPATPPHAHPEDTSGTDIPKGPQYPTPPQPQAGYYAFQAAMTVNGAGVALEACQQLVGALGDLKIRRRRIDSEVDKICKRPMAEKQARISKSVKVPLPRRAKGVRTYKEGLLPAGGEGSTGQEGVSVPVERDLAQSEAAAQAQQPLSQKTTLKAHVNQAQTAEHSSDESTRITAAMNRLDLEQDDAPQAPDQLSALFAQILLGQSSRSIPVQVNQPARKG